MSKPVTPCVVCGRPTKSITGACRRTTECRRTEGRIRSAASRGQPADQRRRAYFAAWYAAHRDEQIAKGRARYEANRDEINARRRARYDPAASSGQRLKWKHGMWPEEWSAMYGAQEGRCYLCNCVLDIETENMTHIDHDHNCCPPESSCTICRRGLACRGCNRAIGFADEDPVRLRRMADALEAAQRRVDQRRTAASRITLFD